MFSHLNRRENSMDHIYIEACNAADVIVPLTAEAERHIAALRLRDGELVKVLNGRGLVAICVVQRTGQKVELAVNTATEHPKPAALTLAMSILDARDRFEFALEKCTELGITRFVPVLADQSQHHRTSAERLVAKAVAAITQCGVAWLPEITAPTTIAELAWGSCFIIGDDKGQPPSPCDLTEDVTVIVGPEGDFSERERAVLLDDPRCRSWAIGRNRLRAETAAIALIANVVSVRS